MYRQLRGYYNGAALNGGMGIRAAMKRLRGGWDTNVTWDKQPGAVKLVTDIEDKFILQHGTLHDIVDKIYVYDTLLARGQPKEARDLKKSLNLTEAGKKVWTYLRTKIHRGGTYKTTTKAMKEAADRRRKANRDWMLNAANSWVGSDPYDDDGNLARRYVGLNVFRPKKGTPGYVNYRSPGRMPMYQWLRDRGVALPEEVRAAMAAAPSAAADNIEDIIDESETEEEEDML